MRNLLIAAAAVAALSACSSVPSGPDCPADSITSSADLGSYVLAPGDRVEVLVFRQPDMSGEFVIDSEGMLSSPLLGRTEATGLTTEQLARRIKEVTTRGGYLVNPAITVTLIQGGEVYVLGEINQSTAVPYKHHMKVVHALANAGGVTYRAGEVRVKRAGCWFDADYETVLAPGDVIMVTERFF
jgi:polysaccharide export outer membrane protein